MVQLPATAAIEYVAACCRTRTRTRTKTVFCPGGLCPFPHPKFNAYTYNTVQAFCAQHRSVTDKQKKTDRQKNDKLGPVAPRGVDLRFPNFQGMQRWRHTTYFIEALYGSDPFLQSWGRKTPPKSRFCHEANECRLSGNITTTTVTTTTKIATTTSIYTLYLRF